MILWVDECSNEDPGPLPGPRFRRLIISLKAGLEAWGTEAEPAETETAEVDFLVTFSNRVIEFWNVEHEIERFISTSLNSPWNTIYIHIQQP